MLIIPSGHSCLLQLILFPNTELAQLIPSHYLLAEIQTSSIAHRFPSYTDTKMDNPPLTLITRQKDDPHLHQIDNSSYLLFHI